MKYTLMKDNSCDKIIFSNREKELHSTLQSLHYAVKCDAAPQNDCTADCTSLCGSTKVPWKRQCWLHGVRHNCACSVSRPYYADLPTYGRISSSQLLSRKGRVPRKRFEDVLRSTTCWPFFMAWPIQSDLQDQRYRAYRIKLLLKQTQVKVLCSAMVTLVEMKFKSTCTSPARLDFWPGFWTSSRPSSYREGMSREHIGDTWFMDSCLGYMQGVATTLIIGLTGLLDLVCIIISDLRLVSSSASEISAFDLTVPHTVFRMRHSVSIKQTIGALVFISTVQN